MKTRLLIATLALAGYASAATLTETHTYSFVPTSFQNLTFSKFTPALGTLTGITVSVSMTKVGGSVAADNDSASGASVDFNSEVWGNLSSTAVTLKDSSGAKILGANTGDLDALDTTTVSLGATTGDLTNQFDVTNAADYYSYAGPTTTASTSDSVGSSYWSGFSGSGTYALRMNAQSLSGISAVSGVQYAVVAPTVSGSVTVSYSYIAAIPEPSTSLLGLIPATLLVVRRRR